jgi:hypothetical protein
MRYFKSGDLYRHEFEKHDAEFIYKCPHYPHLQSFNSRDRYKKHYRNAHRVSTNWSLVNEMYSARTIRCTRKIACACGCCGKLFDLCDSSPKDKNLVETLNQNNRYSYAERTWMTIGETFSRNVSQAHRRSPSKSI